METLMQHHVNMVIQYIDARPNFFRNLEIVRHQHLVAYNHMGAIIADAVLQPRTNYKTTVKPRVEKILENYPDATTTTSLRALGLLEESSIRDFLRWNGRKVETFRCVLALFSQEGIDNKTDLREWLRTGTSSYELQRIRGIGPATVDYFKILVDLPTIAVNKHIWEFLRRTGVQLDEGEYHTAQQILGMVADYYGIDRTLFDHYIWRIMSEIDE